MEVEQGRNFRWLAKLVYITVIFFVTLAVCFSIWRIYQSTTEATVERRQAIVSLAAASTELRFEYLKDLGVSFATRVRFREFISTNDWDGAIGILSDVTENFPYIDRIFITDPSGMLMADVPALSDVRGKNFAFRDWYIGVSDGWKPYVSDVYQRTAEPRYNVVAISVPIVADTGEILGILVLQIRADQLVNWMRSAVEGTNMVAYLVDPKGHPVGNPLVDPQESLLDFSDQPFVAAVLNNERGLGIYSGINGGNESLVVYEPISLFGWGVVVSEEIDSAFATRNEILSIAVLIFLIAVGIVVFLVSLLYLMLMRLQRMSLELDARVESRARAFGEEHAKIQAIIESMIDGVIVSDLRGRVVLANQEIRRLLGYVPSELQGKKIFSSLEMRDRTGKIIPESRRPMLQALHGKITRIPTVTDANFYVRKDGTLFPALVTCAPVLVDGKVAGAVSVLRDATKEYAVDRAKNEFVRLASHQLRTPLTAILWYVQNMIEGSVGRLSKPQTEHLKIIEYSTRRMIRLVNDLLRVSQIDLSQIPSRIHGMELQPVVGSVVEELFEVASERNVSVTVSSPRSLPLVRADELLVRQSLLILVGNAIAFTPAKGRIKIILERVTNDVRISVRDTGIGIPKDEQGRVFQRFFRASNAQKYTGEGTGLGLFIAKEIVNLSKGKIGFSSEEGRGSTFWISFPIVRS
ncbi:hypothetical protein A2348_04175 [Candidatus Uhrbacteria bacterium RIFOXYB12_FULL_58_10]|uniref:histidine kinase n=1 Tax=Candidatus Uhrbacteria bacterium RIFOXYB2_FULL_57_15 TaxID=1802422 RepID=A0A1F7W8Y8_9BACT|nr:MAG: hypothetical protein A2348_04175 [Candidatus Uhrbacteria bacterium RIFOXYB12_FULL_58_10]OGL98848.1 MAG: hypothetical protein A2304_05150 [Candidatus Uhrbacteria bacterium RIFOXYB2_FULL_57_15]OGL98931.1 MAG: hypothetical protein A2501_02250 [Candidatus Uhrbacteria bacterium RIFOXYC12_FULL_57_11]